MRNRWLYISAIGWLVTIQWLSASFWLDTCRAADANHIIETKHTILTFSAREDVAQFHDSINFAEQSSFAGFFSSSSTKDLTTDLIRKVDKLFEKVQLILDMRKEMRPVRVRIFRNSDELGAAYYKIYHRKANVRGWYVYEFNTVFLNVRDVHEGMLAHELGHAIIDHYLEVRPPRATAEILARYVDEHLFEEVKKY